ncbi:ABC transporter substrate-binding protein [Deinococcus sonorensis]|uniref:ABC transporter substrate-binding protein n=2 Tax=Deinococcus sonorensis TaxID=309891 RepID=A0AAU7U5H4_9DEIO
MKTSLLTTLGTTCLLSVSVAMAADKAVTVAFPSDFQSLDPAIGYDTQSWPVIHALFVTLLTYGQGTDLKPWGATDLGQASADGKTYTFHLRKGITFTDGEPTDAAAYKYAIERILDPKTKSPQGGTAGWFGALDGAADFVAGKAKAVRGIQVLDPYTIRFKLAVPDRTFLNALATPFASALPRKAVERLGSDFSHHVVGNGPFVLESWVPGQKAVLTKNPKYFAASQVHVPRLEFTLGLSEQVALLRAQRGEVDVLGNGIPSAQFASIVNTPRFKPYIKSAVQVGTWYLFMNAQKAPFNNKLVRQAVSLAINKPRLVQLMNGRGKVTAQILPPGMPGYDATVSAAPMNVARSTALLKQAGYVDSGALQLVVSTDDPSPKLAQAVQQQLAAIGMKVEIKALPGAEYLHTISSPGTTAIGLSSWYQAYPDPSNFLDVMFKTGYYTSGGWNISGYLNPATDAQLTKLRGQPLKAALPGYQAVQKRILSDFTWIPLFNPVQYNFVNPRVKNVAIHPVWGYVYQDWGLQSP